MPLRVTRAKESRITPGSYLSPSPGPDGRDYMVLTHRSGGMKIGIGVAEAEGRLSPWCH
jgi:hypothetical protein